MKFKTLHISFLLPFILFLGGRGLVFGQWDPQFTLYHLNPYYFNPAAAGLAGNMQVSAHYRTQWTGYTGTFDTGGAPVSQVISVHTPFSALKGGLGFQVLNDNIGAGTITRSFKASYAFHKRFGPSIFSAGASVGTLSRVLDGERYRPREIDDPLIPSTRISLTQPDIDLGVMLYNPGYQLGLSYKHVTNPSFNYGSLTGTGRAPGLLSAQASMLVGLSYTIDVVPTLLIKSDLRNVSTEAGALVRYNNTYFAGLNYRWQDAASFLIGGSFLNNNLQLSYALDYVVFGTVAKAPLSHEIFLSYALKAPRSGKRSIIKTPRYSF